MKPPEGLHLCRFKSNRKRWVYKLRSVSNYFNRLEKYHDRTSCSFWLCTIASWRYASHWEVSLAPLEAHRVTVVATVGEDLDQRFLTHVPSTTMRPFDNLVDPKPCTRRSLTHRQCSIKFATWNKKVIFFSHQASLFITFQCIFFGKPSSVSEFTSTS